MTIPKAGKDHITCLNGIRFWSTTWVVLCHTYSLVAEQFLPLTNTLTLLLGDVSDHMPITVWLIFLQTIFFFILSFQQAFSLEPY